MFWPTAPTWPARGTPSACSRLRGSCSCPSSPSPAPRVQVRRGHCQQLRLSHGGEALAAARAAVSRRRDSRAPRRPPSRETAARQPRGSRTASSWRDVAGTARPSSSNVTVGTACRSQGAHWADVEAHLERPEILIWLDMDCLAALETLTPSSPAPAGSFRGSFSAGLRTGPGCQIRRINSVDPYAFRPHSPAGATLTHTHRSGVRGWSSVLGWA